MGSESKGYCCTPLTAPGLGEADAAELAELFKALADPARLRLLSLIASAPEGEACACDLTAPLERSQPTVSHHLSLLVDAGLVTREKRGRWAWYRLVPERLGDPMELVDHDKHDHVAAMFDRREDAEAAVGELRSAGLGSEHLGVAVRGPAHTAFEYDEERDLAHDAEVGVAAGASFGALAGMALAAIVVPGLGVLGLGGLLAVGAASGLGGGMLGGYLGIAVADREFQEHRQIGETRLAPDQVLVVVCAHGRRDEIIEVLGRHRGSQIEADAVG